MPRSPSYAHSLVQQLDHALAALRRGHFGDPARVVIDGVTSRGQFVDGMTVDGFIHRAVEALIGTGRFYRYADTIVAEVLDDHGVPTGLRTLAVQGQAEPHAAAVLANFLVCSGADGSQSLPPPQVVGALLASREMQARLPRIAYHGRRPTFDAEFALCREGWNADSGILVHGGDVEPRATPVDFAPDVPALERLPPHLRALLAEFAWRSDADLVNFLAALLTGLLVNHFVAVPHPPILIDGNQPGLGKTLLAQVLGWVLDGLEPRRQTFVGDEELEKRLGAQLRESASSLILLDNVRSRLDSPVLEAQSIAPEVRVRLMKQSATVSRPNVYLWVVTSNGTTATGDLVSRSVPIRLRYQGDPAARAFRRDPLEYARRHRGAILAELAGMVVRWVGRGRPDGAHRHRCAGWARVVGGILESNGLGGPFLANLQEAGGEMDQELQALASLAELVVGEGRRAFFHDADTPGADGGTPAEWTPVFERGGVLQDRLRDGSPRSRSTTIGRFLAAKVGRAVEVEAPEGPRLAVLEVVPGRAAEPLPVRPPASVPAGRAVRARPGRRGRGAGDSSRRHRPAWVGAGLAGAATVNLGRPVNPRRTSPARGPPTGRLEGTRTCAEMVNLMNLFRVGVYE